MNNKDIINDKINHIVTSIFYMPQKKIHLHNLFYCIDTKLNVSRNVSVWDIHQLVAKYLLSASILCATTIQRGLRCRIQEPYLTPSLPLRMSRFTLSWVEELLYPANIYYFQINTLPGIHVYQKKKKVKDRLFKNNRFFFLRISQYNPGQFYLGILVITDIYLSSHHTWLYSLLVVLELNTLHRQFSRVNA